MRRSFSEIKDEPVDVCLLGGVESLHHLPPIGQIDRSACFSERVAQIARLSVRTRDPQRLLHQVSLAAFEALHVEQVTVYLLEADQMMFRIAAAVGRWPGEGVGTRVPNRPEQLAGSVLIKGRSMAVTHVLGASIPEPPQGDSSDWRSDLATPVFDGEHVIGVVMARTRDVRDFDVEDKRFLESLSSILGASLQRARSDEALSHAEGLKSVGQLTGGIAHDFNNLLTVISGNLQALADSPRIAGDEGLGEIARATECATRRGAGLTAPLLDISRRRVLHPASLDVGALLRRLAGLLTRTLDERISVATEVAPDCPPCWADAGQLEASLLNLAINARDAMMDGGSLSFRAWPIDSLPFGSGVSRTSPADGGYVAIAVGDTGTGMSDAIKMRAAEPFFTTKEAGCGTGLGLSTVAGFVQRSCGVMLLDSKMGVGTTVTLVLPRHPIDAGFEDDS
ncbi:MAG TPA: ATP-binding protein [Ideonella sp.]|uniref:ATP-binding protein n=1 Tax=Ideonella sp. TaxID=1929293 RepID=UPI002E308ADD|nr:ATP-binding protein [Ideonella sp.]HEX5685078.1 ATP-binding protein [Ideonella sp.]